MMSTRTLALLGDSILDNAPYTRPEPDTTSHLQRIMGAGWSVRRYARDGAVMADIPSQLRSLDGKPSVIVLSVGGNDLTRHIGILEQSARGNANVLDQLDAIAMGFERDYQRVAEAVSRNAERTILCTIYEVRLEPPALARRARIPLGVLNDRIIRIAAGLGLDVLELRSVCTEPTDFVLQIEPSARGAAKIGRAIAGTVTGDPRIHTARLFVS
jgi:lysophospholipase L1-like esterase